MDEGPKGPDGPEGEKGPDGEAKKDKPVRLDEGSGVLVVLGDAGLVADETLQNQLAGINAARQGFFFTQNVVDWLTGSDEMLALRARGARPRQLDTLEDGTMKAIKWGNVAVVPLLILMAGLVVYFVRRHGR
jgi:ABC-type uncharacterized transport system involved in gliding motility auxiliary subunit